jgi:hypothetical protein
VTIEIRMLDSGDPRVVRYRHRHVQLARASARYDAVNVRMEREQLAPGMEYREKAEHAREYGTDLCEEAPV